MWGAYALLSLAFTLAMTRAMPSLGASRRCSSRRVAVVVVVASLRTSLPPSSATDRPFASAALFASLQARWPQGARRVSASSHLGRLPTLSRHPSSPSLITFFSPRRFPSCPPGRVTDGRPHLSSPGSTRSPPASPSSATASTRTLSSRSSASAPRCPFEGARSRPSRRVVLTNPTWVVRPLSFVVVRRITKKVCMGVHQGVTTVELDVSLPLPRLSHVCPFAWPACEGARLVGRRVEGARGRVE
jgi:hypothetical protein